MVKVSMPKGTAPKMPHLGGGLPGSSSRARINEAAGVKVKSEPGQPKASSGVSQAGKANATLPVTSSQSTATAGPDDTRMPAKHPGAKTTKRQGSAGWDD